MATTSLETNSKQWPARNRLISVWCEKLGLLVSNVKLWRNASDQCFTWENEINIELVIYANSVWHPIILLVVVQFDQIAPCHCVKFANSLRMSHCFQGWWNTYRPMRSLNLLLYIARTSVILTKYDAQLFWELRAAALFSEPNCIQHQPPDKIAGILKFAWFGWLSFGQVTLQAFGSPSRPLCNMLRGTTVDQRPA